MNPPNNRYERNATATAKPFADVRKLRFQPGTTYLPLLQPAHVPDSKRLYHMYSTKCCFGEAGNNWWRSAYKQPIHRVLDANKIPSLHIFSFASTARYPATPGAQDDERPRY